MNTFTLTIGAVFSTTYTTMYILNCIRAHKLNIAKLLSLSRIGGERIVCTFSAENILLYATCSYTLSPQRMDRIK